VKPAARPLLACVAVAAAAVLAACGLGPGEERAGAGVELRVTRDYGHDLLLSKGDIPIRESDTVMRLLDRNAEIETRYGGGFVQSIDGLAGHGKEGAADWFFYVNGIQSEQGAADYELSPGDVVQWDRHGWGTTAQTRAIVGAYPQPLLDGLDGKRFPVRVECDDAEAQVCGDVKRTLRDGGVPATGATLGAPGNQNVARIVVAPWASARRLPSARFVELGPKRSGVFARFVDGGGALELLDADGEVVRTERAGAGLLAALRPTDTELVWLVTGTDAAGVEAAAAALRPAALRDAFAVAVGGERIVKLPVVAGKRGP